MTRSKLVAFALAFWPATAFAQTLQGQPLLAKWALPALLFASLVVLCLGLLLRANRWTRSIGVAIWMLWMTLGACLAIYAMPEAARAAPWQLPALVVGICAFAVAGERTLRQFKRV